MLPYDTTDRSNMAVYSRLSILTCQTSRSVIKKGETKITMYAEFLILVMIFLIIKRLEKLDK